MRNVIIVLILVLVVAACEDDEKKIKPTIEDLTESVYSSVTIKPVDIYSVYASAPGIIDTILVDDGDTVEINQLIAEITSDISKYNAKNAELSLELARSKYKGESNELERLEEEIEANNEQLKQDSIDYMRQVRLKEKSVGTTTELERAKLKFELAQKKRSMLRNQYEQLKKELRNNYKQTKNALSKARTNLSDYDIRSKLDGVVYSINKNIGELITQQEPIAKIGRKDSFLIELEIDEVDIASIRIGQTVIIALDAYRGQTFEAKTTKILPIKNERTQTFKVEAMFVNPPKKLYAGLSGEGNIIIDKKKNVMTIPIEYLATDSTVVTEDGKKSVDIGLRNIDKVEIISGIDTSTVIKKP